jgi:hypothetical protein
VDIGNGYSEVRNTTQSATPKRPEMRGPQNDVDDILSGLKMKTISAHEQPGTPSNTPSNQNQGIRVEDESMISISSLRDMSNMTAPKRTNRRKNTSDKNTISLGDI